MSREQREAVGRDEARAGQEDAPGRTGLSINSHSTSSANERRMVAVNDLAFEDDPAPLVGDAEREWSGSSSSRDEDRRADREHAPA